MDFAVLWHGFLDARQLGFLLIVADGDTALLPRLTSLPNSSVVDMTAEHQGTPKYPLLFRSGLEFILIGFAHALVFHVKVFCLAGTKAETLILL
jgi:hypothetical protein